MIYFGAGKAAAVQKISPKDTADISKLPQANRKILRYAISQIGKKCGDGVCHTLIDSAIYRVNHKWTAEQYVKGYGKIIDFKEARPGDIVTWYSYSGTAGHIEIILKKNYNGTATTLGQNHGELLGENLVENLDKSIVRITENQKILTKDMAIVTIYRCHK